MSSPPPSRFAIAEESALAPIGADRRIALNYAPSKHRDALAALWAIDSAMGDVLRTTSEPAIGQIRLAWWRDRLQELDRGLVPAEPRLQAAAGRLLPRKVSGTDLAALVGGWWRLFDNFPWGVETSEAIWFRGRLLFGLAATLLGSRTEEIEAVGGGWALVDTARHCSDAQSRAMLLDQARTLTSRLKGTRFPSVLRTLSMLGALAIRDVQRREPFEAEGAPARIALMMKHRLTGRL